MATDKRQNIKTELRSSIQATLSGLSALDVSRQSEICQSVVLSLPEYRQARRIGIYLSMPKAEAQTDILVHDALESGKEVFVPYIYSIGIEKPKRKVMDMLELTSVREYEGLGSDAWGIPKLPMEGREQRENAMGGVGRSFESDGSAKAVEVVDGLDVIVVPAVAFDTEMNRLGHGAAFYDTFLSRFCESEKRPKPFLGESMCFVTRDRRLTPRSRVMSGRAGSSIREARHARLGLAGGCRSCWGWKVADFKRYPISITLAFELVHSGYSHRRHAICCLARSHQGWKCCLPHDSGGAWSLFLANFSRSSALALVPSRRPLVLLNVLLSSITIHQSSHFCNSWMRQTLSPLSNI